MPVLIFDLDGTLVDSKQDLSASVNHVRQAFDLPVLSEAEIAGYIGDGARMQVVEIVGEDLLQLREIVLGNPFDPRHFGGFYFFFGRRGHQGNGGERD